MNRDPERGRAAAGVAATGIAVAASGGEKKKSLCPGTAACGLSILKLFKRSLFLDLFLLVLIYST